MSKESIGTVTGLINCGGQIGGLLSPTIMGFLIGAFSRNYNVAFLFLVASAILTLIISLTTNTNKSNEMIRNSATELT
ncbi:hypothetical protein [Neobacillus cucumis]|uniref:hypothetical protein n=1 Tax=Neobacillus cucumis TaxID=1740721 RepID=UPI002E1F1968|nr:hypothetical protein [Neobacillus cucumis]